MAASAAVRTHERFDRDEVVCAEICTKAQAERSDNPWEEQGLGLRASAVSSIERTAARDARRASFHLHGGGRNLSLVVVNGVVDGLVSGFEDYPRHI